ncbi:MULTISPECIES: KGK domain-containing protein [Nostoc]|uniref:KGK family protein n=2 Tax=Nostoc TaxID=1177 RepID=A0ABR8I5Q2_9NOSO|nr:MULTISPECIES: KGK domain-containing protein [Nostoc]MBD2559205.1 KGK family protein [Nostoc linckia FACHB-391]MBD2646251.1 KGK family protein [Nostoc foliaceum FACHB-393]
MENEFISLECEDDVIFFNKDTFKVSKLRELVIREIANKWHQKVCSYKAQISDVSVGNLFGNIPARDESIPVTEFQLHAVKECQVLQSGKNWQKGKLEIRISIYPNSHKANNLYLQFYPDEPIKL